jgi:hypothetical protein
MKITIVAFEGCMTSTVYCQADAFAIAAYISCSRNDASWSGHDVKMVIPGGLPARGYGEHSIEPPGSLAGAEDSDVVLIPAHLQRYRTDIGGRNGLIAWRASFPRGSMLLARAAPAHLAEAGLPAQTQSWTDGGGATAFAHSVPDIRDAAEAMRAMVEGRPPAFLGP